MAQEVNLITVTAEEKKKMSAFFSICLFILLVTVTIAAGALLYMLFLKTRIAATTNEGTKTLQEVTSLDRERVQFLTVSERLATVRKIIPATQLFSERLRLISSFLPQGASVVDMTAEGTRLELQMTTSNLSSMSTFLNTTLAKIPEEKNAQIKQIDIKKFEVNTNGSGYTVGISFIFATPLN